MERSASECRSRGTGDQSQKPKARGPSARATGTRAAKARCWKPGPRMAGHAWPSLGWTPLPPDARALSRFAGRRFAAPKRPPFIL
jgi:hypothetical protein